MFAESADEETDGCCLEVKYELSITLGCHRARARGAQSPSAPLPESEVDG